MMGALVQLSLVVLIAHLLYCRGSFMEMDHLWLELLIYCPMYSITRRRNVLHLVWRGATCSVFLVQGIKSLEDDFCTKWRI